MNSSGDAIECQNAIELLEQLRMLPFDSKAPEIVARYIFRGQGDASWQLIPSALRPKTVHWIRNPEVLLRLGPDTRVDVGARER